MAGGRPRYLLSISANAKALNILLIDFREKPLREQADEVSQIGLVHSWQWGARPSLLLTTTTRKRTRTRKRTDPGYNYRQRVKRLVEVLL